MAKFYFTYEGDIFGTAKGKPRWQAYKGGWTEIEATDWRAARAMYNAAHLENYDREHCSGYDFCLSEDEFEKLYSADAGINGLRCVERISLKVDVLERGAKNV